MKRGVVLFALIAITLLDLQLFAGENSLKVTPAKPKGGEEVSIVFNAAGTALANAEKIEMTAYLLGSRSDKPMKFEAAYDIEMKKENAVWSATIRTTPLTDCVGLVFVDNDTYDSNDGKGYFVNFYDADGNEAVGSKLGFASLLGGMGDYFLKMKRDDKRAYDIMEGAFGSHPELKPAYLREYLGAMKGALTKETYDVLLLHNLETLRTRTDLQDDAYSMIVGALKGLKMKDKADEVEAFAVKKYPSGQTALVQKYHALQAIADLERKITYAVQMEKELQGNSRRLLGYYQVIEALIKEGRFDLLKGLLNNNRALTDDFSINYTLLSNLLKANKELEVAATAAEKAVALARTELAKPLTEREPSRTEKQALRSRRASLGRIQFMYGDVLGRLNNKAEALRQVEEAVALIELKDLQSDQLELYARCLVENRQNAKAQPVIEDAMKASRATEKMKELLKEIYVQKNGSDKGYGEYVSALENAGKKDAREKLHKEMVHEPAPMFTLKDLAGKNVALADLRGKVVVLDFWATWCGFCKASFPGMQKAINKFADANDVKFLFIDTRETIDNVHKAVSDYITKNKFTFHVLLDSKDKVYADYRISGLPTKFVLDKEGNIRFKVVGYPGDENAMVEEMVTMISMLK